MPPSGPPICTALIARPSTRPPATSSHSSRTVTPNGTSTTPGPGEALVEADELAAAVRAERAEVAVGLGAARGDEGHVRQRLDVVDDGRQPVEPALGGERRARGDRAAQPVQAGEQRRLLPDDVGARALDDATSKEKPEPRMSSPSRPAARAASIAASSAGLRARVLRAHEHDALASRRPRSPRAPCPRAGAPGCAPSGACRCTSRDRPRRRCATMKRRSAGAARVKRHFCAAGNQAPPRPHRSASATCSRNCSGVQATRGRAAAPTSRPPRSAPARAGGCARRAPPASRVAPASTRSTTPGPASITSPSRTAGALWQKPRQTVSASETEPSAARSPSARPSPASKLVLVRAAGRGEARGPRADAHVAAPARGEQVVVERRDAVDGRLGQARRLGGRADVVVRELAALAHGSAQQLDDGRRAG